jgi:hypothetical protein
MCRALGRFLLHTLPDGFHRIRHYGFLANGSRSDSLVCRGFVQSGFYEVALTTNGPARSRHATSQNPQDSQIGISMIHGWSAFGGLTHNSKLPVLKLESRGYDRFQCGLALGPFSGRSGHGRQAKTAGSVENDPGCVKTLRLR